MIIDKDKFELARARAGIINVRRDLCVNHSLALKIKNGEEVQIRTVIRLAKLLGVDPAEIVKEVNA